MIKKANKKGKHKQIAGRNYNPVRFVDFVNRVNLWLDASNNGYNNEQPSYTYSEQVRVKFLMDVAPPPRSEQDILRIISYHYYRTFY